MRLRENKKNKILKKIRFLKIENSNEMIEKYHKMNIK